MAVEKPLEQEDDTDVQPGIFCSTGGNASLGDNVGEKKTACEDIEQEFYIIKVSQIKVEKL